MRSIVRHFFTIISALSLLLCIFVCVLWVRSYWHVDLLGRDGAETANHWQRGGNVFSGSGSLGIEWWLRQNEASTSKFVAGWGHYSSPARSAVRPWHCFTYSVQSLNSARPASDGRAMPTQMTYVHRLTFPHALVALIFAAPVALWMFRAIRRRRIEARIKQRLCATCGYDLRASPERCPECGAANPLAI